MINPTSSISAGVTAAATNAATAESVQSLSFSDILNGMLSPDTQGQVNEEQLFSALIDARLTSLKGEKEAAAYKDRFETNQSAMMMATGRTSVEDSARKALESLMNDGLLSQAEAESIHAQAFQGAQLDDNATALYDSLGSSYDNTIAVALVEMAIQSAESKVSSYDSGEVDAGRLAFDIQTNTGQTASSGSTSSGQDAKGLIWKPISESNGNVAVVLQPFLKGDVDSVLIQDSLGNTIEKVNLTKVDDVGRSIFRLRQPGAKYPDNLTVQVALKNGEQLSYRIPEPANRTVF